MHIQGYNPTPNACKSTTLVFLLLVQCNMCATINLERESFLPESLAIYLVTTYVIHQLIKLGCQIPKTPFETSIPTKPSSENDLKHLHQVLKPQGPIYHVSIKSVTTLYR